MLQVLASCAILAGGCRRPLHLKSAPTYGAPSRCDDGVCLQIVAMDSTEQLIGVWLDSPPATLLINARVSDAGGPACRGGFPVEWVTVDEDVHRVGPAEVGGSHGIVLSFPMKTWMRDWSETFLDVEVSVAGAARCLRTRLTDAKGKQVVGS
jgi:hypothetical protein